MTTLQIQLVAAGAIGFLCLAAAIAMRRAEKGPALTASNVINTNVSMGYGAIKGRSNSQPDNVKFIYIEWDEKRTRDYDIYSCKWVRVSDELFLASKMGQQIAAVKLPKSDAIQLYLLEEPKDTAIPFPAPSPYDQSR